MDVRAGDDGPSIIIDAGTGIRRLGKEMMQSEFGAGTGQAHLLISHTHWDHIQGLPFFSPLYQTGNKFFVYARQRDDTHLRAVFASQTDSPYFPVPFDNVQADVAFRELVEGARFEIGPVKVSCTRLNHPWIAIAYRIDVDGAAVVLLRRHRAVHRHPDRARVHPPAAQAGRSAQPDGRGQAGSAMRDGVVRLCEGADLVIYDTQFTPEEYKVAAALGPLAPRRRDRDRARRQGQEARACSTTRRCAPTTRTTRSLRTARPRWPLAAAEGMSDHLADEGLEDHA